MKYPILCFLFLFAVATTKADDIATIRSFLNNKTDDVAVLHDVHMACLSLTRTGTEEAVPLLKQLLEDERFSTVARTALINIPGGIERTIPVQPELPHDAALLGSILRDGEPGLLALIDSMKNEKTSFKVIQRAVIELKSDKTGTIVLANMGNLSEEKQAALVRNLGARKDTAIVPFLMILARGDQPELRLAAIDALGEAGDLRAVDTLLHLAGTPAKETADGRRQQRS